MTCKKFEIGTEKQNGLDVGRDPRKMKPEELEKMGHKNSSLGKIIRLHCLECAGGSKDEVRLCTAVSCHLWPFRMSKNPFRKREMTQEQKDASIKRLAKARAKKA